VRLALLLAAACLGLTGCATIKSWFASPTPPAALVEQPDESARPEARPPAPAAPRVTPPAPVAPAAPRVAPPAPVVPRPPAPAPAAPTPAPEVPPPVLSPVLSAVDEQRLRAETQQRIEGAEQRLRQIDPAKLAAGQQDSLLTVQSFLDKAREAVQAKDIQRAYTLADKAFLLADELARRPR
jgi:hypothetical protein